MRQSQFIGILIVLTVLLLIAPHPASAQVSQGPVVIQDGGTGVTQASVKAAGVVTPNVIGVQGNASGIPIPVTNTPSGTQDVNLKQVNGTTVLTGSGATGAGSERVTIAVDSATVAGSASIPAGSNVIGHVIADTGSTTAVTGNVTVVGTGTFANQSTLQTQTDTTMVGGVNIKEINAVTPLMGNGVTGTESQRVTIASDNTAFAVNNTQQGTASQNVAQVNAVTVLTGTGATGTGSQRVTVAVDSATVAGSASLPAGSALIGEAAPVAIATTTDSLLGCYVQSGTGTTASTNSTNCKGSAGNLYQIRAINTTATVTYLRMYNLTTAPTCSSATGFIESIPIPASATGAGLMDASSLAIGYTTGISFCVTGGGGNNDNTNAVAGVFITLKYK